MSGSAHGWPFLVARGRELGYRTILAPGFLTEHRLHGLLSDAANGQGLDSPREVEVERQEVGRLTLVYQTEQVSEAELDGGRGEGLATDEHGRPLEMLYGIVYKGRLGGHVDGGDLAAARTEAIASYRRFLAEENGFGVDTSNAMALRGMTAVAAAAPPKPARRAIVDSAPPKPARRAARGGLAVTAVVAALAALPLALMLPGGSDTRVVDVRADIDCIVPTSFVLQGAVRTDGEADVVYHWEAPGWRAPSRQLAFERAGTEELPPERLEAASIPNGVALVVEQPEQSRAEAARAPGCTR
jgi:hypothetical protein